MNIEPTESIPPLVFKANKKRREEPTSAATVGGATVTIPSPRLLDPLPDQIREETERKLERMIPSTIASQPIDSTFIPTSTTSHAESSHHQPTLSISSISPRVISEVSSSIPIGEIQTAVTKWLSLHGAAIIHEWLNTNAAKIFSSFSIAAQSPINRVRSEYAEEEDHDSAPTVSITKPEEKEEEKQTLLKSIRNRAPRSSSPPPPSNEDSDVPKEVNPRSMINSKNRAKINDSLTSSTAAVGSQANQGVNPMGGPPLIYKKSPLNTIKTEPAIEAGAAVTTGSHSTAEGFPRQITQGGSPPSGSGTIGMGKNRGSASKSVGDPDALLVEDVKVSQKVGHAALTRAHFKVDVASDGETAVEKYKQYQNSLRVILMDIHLPGISGIEATERIRTLERNSNSTPVLVYGLTGNVNEENLRAYEQAGMDGCIVKGKLLAEAVKQAMQMSERNPGSFVNLCEKKEGGENTNTAVTLTTPVADTSIEYHMTDSRPTHLTISSSSALSSTSPPIPSPTSSFPLPLPASGLLSPSSSSAARLASAAGPELLLVEDVRVSQRVAAQALTRAHFRVEAANDGESAVEKYRQHFSTLKIILMDVGLPGISGIEATEKIRSLEQQLNPTNRVLVFGLTGNVDSDNLREYEEVGMNGCIGKGTTQLAAQVRLAVELANSMPNQFINLVGKGEDTTAPVSIPSPPAIPAATPIHIQNQHTGGEISEEDIHMTETPSPPSDRMSAISIENTTAGIGTPKPQNPRTIINQRFPARGTVRPGIGLPSASSGGSTSPTSPPTTVSTNANVGMGSSRSSNLPDVLLVEDVKVSQKIAQQALQRVHYKVDVAGDGESAIEKYKLYYNNLRIILMDVGLPGISGIEATEKIRALESNYFLNHQVEKPVLIFGLTGNVGEGNLRQYQEAGMNGCIVKGTLLVDAVEKAIQKIENNPNEFVNLVGGPQ